MKKQNDYQQRMNDAMKKLEEAHISALSEELLKYRNSVERLLDNGRTIYEQANGEKFQKLHEKRRELWHKVFTIEKCISILYKQSL